MTETTSEYEASSTPIKVVPADEANHATTQVRLVEPSGNTGPIVHRDDRIAEPVIVTVGRQPVA